MSGTATDFALGDYAWLRHPGLMRRVIDAAAQNSGIRAADILGPCREREIAHLRFAVWLALHTRGFGYAPIARRFGRDHSSIMHGVKRAREIAAGNPAYAAFIDALAAVRAEPVSQRNSSFEGRRP